MRSTQELMAEHDAVLLAPRVLERRVEAAPSVEARRGTEHLEQLLRGGGGRFETIESERVGAGRHEAHHTMLRRLRDADGIA